MSRAAKRSRLERIVRPQLALENQRIGIRGKLVDALRHRAMPRWLETAAEIVRADSTLLLLHAFTLALTRQRAGFAPVFGFQKAVLRDVLRAGKDPLASTRDAFGLCLRLRGLGRQRVGLRGRA